jgi:hypothetical protein
MSLAEAIIKKDLSLVSRLLSHGEDVNQIDEYGFTPLIQAAIVNSLEICQLLLAQGADVNQKDMVGGTALHWAVENNHLPMVRALLEKGADPNAYNHNGEPVLIKPLLREQTELKLLLLERGAQVDFAQDYLHAKLLGHRYDLRGSVDIVSAAGDFVEVSMEGFFLEFSLNLVRQSLQDYMQNYAAREHSLAFPVLKEILLALKKAAQLMQLTQYQTNLSEHGAFIDDCLREPVAIIPTVYAGHAICFIRYYDYWVRVDRRKQGQTLNGVNIFKMHQPNALSADLLRHLIFDKKEPKFVEQTLTEILGLQLQTRLLMAPQMSGNCSWANVVAAVPALYYLYAHANEDMPHFVERNHPALELYYDWRQWDRFRALGYFIQAFDQADRKRKASIASLLAAVMFQRFYHEDTRIIPMAKRILKILRTDAYAYILKNYLDFYSVTRKTKAGENLKKLIEICDAYF